MPPLQIIACTSYNKDHLLLLWAIFNPTAGLRKYLLSLENILWKVKFGSILFAFLNEDHMIKPLTSRVK